MQETDINIDESNFIFTNIISGLKGIPLNTTILLVNDTANNTLNLTYNLDGNKMIKISLTDIKNITFKTRVRMQNINKEPTENDTKSTLLSAALFGGNPILQVAGQKGMSKLFDTMSDNYNKVDYNSYYEITLEANINGQDFRIILTSDTNPEEFISKITKNSTH